MNIDLQLPAVASILNSPLTKTAAALVGNMLEPVSHEIGFQLSEMAKRIFPARQARVVARAGEFMDAINPEEINPVPPKLLKPILEGAALQEEHESGSEGMFDRWASLLANSSNNPSEVPPSFPEILRQLTPLDARLFEGLIVMNPAFNNRLLFDQVWSVFHSLKLTNYPRWRSADPRTEVRQELEEDLRKIWLSIQNLIRLSLIERDYNLDIPWRDRFPESRKIDKSFAATVTGRAFYKACQPPMKSA